MKNTYAIAYLLMLLIFSFSGCTSTSAPESSTMSTELSQIPGYVAPEEQNPLTGYPGLNEKTNLILEPGMLPDAPKDVPDSRSGHGAISGVLFSFSTNLILADTLFYLTPAMGPDDTDLPPALFGPQEGSGDIVGRTDDQGRFFLDNVPPGNYYIVVEAPMNWAVGLEKSEESAPRMITVEEGGKYPLGVVFVSWP